MEKLMHLISQLKDAYYLQPIGVQLNYVVMFSTALLSLFYKLIPSERVFGKYNLKEWDEYDKEKSRKAWLELYFMSFLYSTFLTLVLHLVGLKYFMYGLYFFPVLIIMYYVIRGTIPRKKS